MNQKQPVSGRAALYTKIAAVAGEAHSVEKDGNNTQLRYRYPTPAVVMQLIKPLLARHNLALLPEVESVEKVDTGAKTQSGQPQVLTRVNMVFHIADAEGGEMLSVRWCGEGLDWSDKGIAKAQTVAVRTFLLNFFQIPSVDEDTDPDRDQPQQHGRSGNGNQQEGVRTRPPARSAQAPQQQERVDRGTGEIVEAPTDPERAAFSRRIKAQAQKLQLSGTELKRFSFAHFGTTDSSKLSTEQLGTLASDLELYQEKIDLLAWIDRKLTEGEGTESGATASSSGTAEHDK